ncbi:MAG: hypothetical protein E3J56_08430, partial [Candidatus Aminicenantes bacterium]
MSFTKESGEQEVSQYLRETYGYDLSHFEFSLRNIKTFFDLIELKKKRAQFQQKIDDLESEKRKVIEHIDDFLSNSGLWDEIQTESNVWTNENKVTYIKEEFCLNQFFEKIDDKVRSLQKKIILLDGFEMETEDKKKRVQHKTLISLVWFYSMFKGEVTNTQKFKDIGELLSWFSDNKPEFMDELFGEKIELDIPAIKATYDRYINNPTDDQKVYQELAY